MDAEVNATAIRATGISMAARCASSTVYPSSLSVFVLIGLVAIYAGVSNFRDKTVTITDLPGIYSLSPYSQSGRSSMR